MSSTSNPQVMSHIAIRRAIGGLGLLFPVALLIYAGIRDAMQPSISHFYYTEAGDTLVGCLVAIGIFLLTYRGYPEGADWPRFLPGDRTTAVVAGLGAIGVAFFPTAALDGRSLCLGVEGIMACEEMSDMLTTLPDPITGVTGDTTSLHRYAAMLFFVPLAYFCLVLFPIGPRGNPARRAELWTYYICGAVILICLVVLWRLLGNEDEDSGNAVFWFETFAVWAFSVAWLVKGKVLANMPGFRRDHRSEDNPTA